MSLKKPSQQKKKSGKENLIKGSEEIEAEIDLEKEEDLPPYPGREEGKKTKHTSLGDTTIEEGEFEEPEPTLLPDDIEDLCGEIYGACYEIWKVFMPSVRSLSDREKRQVQKVLSRIVIRKDLVRYAKDEFLLLFYVSLHIGSRLKEIKEVKPIDNNDSGQAGERKDHTSKGTDKKP